MGYECVVYGVIVGISLKGQHFRTLQIRNERTIRLLERDDEFPWVDLSIFALPGPDPIGTYRRQIIHFGLSLKDDTCGPDDEAWWDEWLDKFEAVLRKLYWTSARLHFETDFTPRREYYWVASEAAKAKMWDDPDFAEPVTDWHRSIQNLPGDKLAGT